MKMLTDDRTAHAPSPAAAASPAADAGEQNPHVTIVLPCHNEQGHIVTEVTRICAAMDASEYDYELVAYDDAFTDETLARLQEAAPQFPHLRIVHFRRNGGSGTVRRIGTQDARGQIVVWTDADMTYPNERIPELVQMLETDLDTDQIVGARTSEEGTHKLLRVPAKWFIRKVAERLTNCEIPDLNSGLRAFKREVALPYLRLLPPGFSCVTTITIAFLSNQHDVRYVPIEYAKRAGTSKFHFVRDAYRYILQVLRMVMYFNPLKVLMPIALALLGLACSGIYDIGAPLHIVDDIVLSSHSYFYHLILLRDLRTSSSVTGSPHTARCRSRRTARRSAVPITCSPSTASPPIRLARCWCPSSWPGCRWSWRPASGSAGPRRPPRWRPSWGPWPCSPSEGWPRGSSVRAGRRWPP